MLHNPMDLLGTPVSARRLQAGIKRAISKAAAQQHWMCVVEDDNGRYNVLPAEASTPVPHPIGSWGILYAKVSPDGVVYTSEED